jgi:hypothetical protein
MLEALLTLTAVSLLGSALVPATILVMARLGCFEPIEFVAFGHLWRFNRQGWSSDAIASEGVQRENRHLAPLEKAILIPIAVVFGPIVLLWAAVDFIFFWDGNSGSGGVYRHSKRT